MIYNTDDRITNDIGKMDTYEFISVNELFLITRNHEKKEVEKKKSFLETVKVREEIKKNVNERILSERRVISLGNIPGFFIIDTSIKSRKELILKLYVPDDLVGEVVGKNATNLKIIIKEIEDMLNYKGRIVLKVYGKRYMNNPEAVFKSLNRKKDYRVIYNHYGENIEFSIEDKHLIGFDRYGIVTLISLDVNDMTSEHIVYKNIVKILKVETVFNNIGVK